MSNLLTVGSIAFDSIKTPFGEVNKTLGGSASYFSLAASFFTTPSVVAVVGQDFGDEYLKILKDKKIDTSGIKKESGKTFAWGGEYSFDLNNRTTLFTELNVIENFKPNLLPDHKASQYVFLGNIYPSLQKEVFSQITAPKFIGLDTMNFWIEKAPKELEEVLKLVNVLIINDSEARELTKEHNILKAAKKILGLMGKDKILIIKRGEYGLLMFKEEEIFHLPGFPLEDVLDPTGAGDTFAGGFMGHLAKTDNLSWENLKKACVVGSCMASFCVEKMGTQGLQELTQPEIEERCKKFKDLTHFETL